MQKTIAFGALLFFLAFSLIHCAPEPKLSLNRAMRVEVDSLYKKQIPELKEMMDSLCAIEKERILAIAVDSIIQKRLAERKKKLGY